MANQTSCSDLEFTTVHFILAFTKLLLTLIATVATSFLARLLYRDCSQKIPHYVRFLMLNVCVSYLFKNFYVLYKSTANILVYITGANHLHVSYNTCVIEQIFFIVPSTCRHLSFFLIGIERLFKTFYFPNCNESNELFLTLLISSLVATWSLPFLLHFALLNYNHGLICFCVLSKIWPDEYVKLFAIFLTILPFITVITYCTVYRRNRSILSKFVIKIVARNLTERFIQWSNVKVSSWLIPVVVISLVISIAGTVLALIISMCRVVNNNTDITVVTSVIGTVYVFDNVSFPLFCIRFNDSLKQVLRSKHNKIYKVFWPFFETKDETNKKSWRITFSCCGRGNQSPNNTQNLLLVEENTTKENLRRVDAIRDFHIDPERQAELLENIWNLNAPINSRK